MSRKPVDCYIDVWDQKNFEGAHLRIEGPAEFPTLMIDSEYWGDHIGSLRVGPTAFVLAYKNRHFKKKMVAFGPGQEVPDLDHFKLDDEIESIKIIDSLKILYRPIGEEAQEPSHPEEIAAARGKRKKRR